MTVSSPPRVVPVRLNRTALHPRPVRYRALVRLSLRRHRGTLAATAVASALLTVWVLRTAHDVIRVRAERAAASCAEFPYLDRCDATVRDVSDALQAVQHAQFALVIVPALVAALLGAPLLAQEYERRTHRLLWTQSVPRQRWLTGQLLVLGGTSVAVGIVAAVLGGRLRAVTSPTLTHDSSAFSALPYNSFGPVLATATVLAFAIGVLAGELTRRTVPAMVCALAGYTGVLTLLTWLRRFLRPTLTRFPPHGYDLAPDDWLLRDGVVTPDGRRLSYAQCGPTGCPEGSRVFDVYHSASQLWPTQWTQAALTVPLIALALLTVHRSIRRRLP
ncbi:ABC transporter permease subunit [Streptomyces murinus]|uniref:ABC transporter permease subunit n=1 Tax=Streptomyces murinus TaxID=33900 RepID=UPI0018F28F73|nr:ABC transporter permease subunit [Streptomyces murinus]